MDRIDEIKARISVLPKKMEWKDTRVYMTVQDPKDPKRKIRDPHGRYQQTRTDVVDAEDPFKKPIIHFHKFPDHPAYEANFEAFGEAFIHLRDDIEFLLNLVEGKS